MVISVELTNLTRAEAVVACTPELQCAMFSKVLLAYVLLALGAAPASLLANGVGDSEAPGVVGHSPSPSATTPGASTSENTSPSAAQSPANVTTVPSAAQPPANATTVPSAAHPPANATTNATTTPSSAHPPANATTNATAVPETGKNHSEAVPGQAPKLQGNHTAPDSPPTTICFPKSTSHGVEDHHCRK